MPLTHFNVSILEDGRQAPKNTPANADDPNPFNPLVDMTNKVHQLEVHDESGVNDDRVNVVLLDDGWRSNYAPPLGRRRRGQVFLSRHSVIRVSINNVFKGAYEFAGLDRHPHQGLVTLNGVIGFDGDEIAKALVEFLDNGVIFGEEPGQLQKKPSADAFHIPQPDEEEDVASYIWRFQARWERMLGTARWDEILDDLGERTFSFVTGQFNSVALSTPTLGPYIASLLRDGEKPRYREVIQNLNKFGLKLYYGETPASWRVADLPLNDPPRIVPFQWAHTAVTMQDSDFIPLTPSEQVEDAAVMNDAWKDRELTFSIESSTEPSFNLVTGQFSQEDETKVYRSGEGQGDSYDVGEGQGITPEQVGFVHVEAKRLYDAYHANKLNASIDISPRMSPQTLINLGQDSWLVQSVHHIVRVSDQRADAHTTIESVGLTNVTLEDVYRANPPPYNGDEFSPVNDVPAAPKLEQWRSNRESSLYKLIPTYDELSPQDRDLYTAFGVFDRLGNFQPDWEPPSTWLYLIICPPEKGNPLARYDIQLTDDMGREEYTIVQSPPTGVHVHTFQDVLVDRTYNIAVTAVNEFGSSPVQRIVSNALGSKAVPTPGTNMNLPRQQPELLSLFYTPKKSFEEASLQGSIVPEFVRNLGGALARSVPSSIWSALKWGVQLSPFTFVQVRAGLLLSDLIGLFQASEDGIQLDYVVNGNGDPVLEIKIEKRVRTNDGTDYEAWSADGQKILGFLQNILAPGDWDDVRSSGSGRFANETARNSVGTLQRWSRMDSLQDGVTAERVRQYRISVRTKAGTRMYFTEALREQDFRRAWRSGDGFIPAFGETAPWGGEPTISFYEQARLHGLVRGRQRRFSPETYSADEWTI